MSKLCHEPVTETGAAEVCGNQPAGSRETMLQSVGPGSHRRSKDTGCLNGDVEWTGFIHPDDVGEGESSK